MQGIRRRLRACALLALLSIGALAAGPTVSRMLLPARGSIVPMHGPHARHHPVAMARATAPETQPVPSHKHALEPCELCLLAAHAFTFVEERPALMASVECTRPALASLASAVPRLRCDWSPASSRGPPAQG